MMPNHPIQAIAISESLSVILPFFNSKNYAKFLSLYITLSYASYYSSDVIKIYFNETTIYDKIELTGLSLLTCYLLFYYFC
tara:strand:+ start:2159 stop:2401 length:243 start_codon:yes stop_codon:yes gene_type:complete